MRAGAFRGSESSSREAAQDERALAPPRVSDRASSSLALIRIATAILIVAAIFFARSVLIPIALALLLSFLLRPLVDRLRKWGLPRVGAVLASVSLAALVLGVVIIAVTFQAVELADSLPSYRSNIEVKLETLRTKPGGKLDRFLRAVRGINGHSDGATSESALTALSDSAATTSDPSTSPMAVEPPPKPVPVEVVEHSLTPLDVLSAVTAPALTAGIVIVLVVFILLAREDIRNRVIYLLGNRPGQMYVTTQVLDDAAARVSRYLLMQLVVAVCYGVQIGVGLALIGVPNSLLWGLLAIALRFVPYIGPWVAALFPLAMAFAVDPGWGMVLWTAVLFVIVELVLNNVIEPWLYGSSTGMSPVGVLLSTVFWASLWGPVGLIVATPLTACLVALGRYIPGLSALSLLLGDQPALPMHARVYQRLLAMDPDEPDDIARGFLKDHSLEELYGQVFLPALKLIEAERHSNPAFDKEHYDFVIAQFRALIDEVSDHVDAHAKDDRDATARGTTLDGVEKQAPGELESRASVLCMPAHNESDELLALMLAVLLRRRGVSAEAISAALLTSERLQRLEGAVEVCLCAIPPYATVHMRNMIKRIRTCGDAANILVLYGDERTSADELVRRIAANGAVAIVTNLDQAIEQLRSPHASRKPSMKPAVSSPRSLVGG